MSISSTLAFNSLFLSLSKSKSKRSKLAVQAAGEDEPDADEADAEDSAEEGSEENGPDLSSPVTVAALAKVLKKCLSEQQKQQVGRSDRSKQETPPGSAVWGGGNPGTKSKLHCSNSTAGRLLCTPVFRKYFFWLSVQNVSF